MPSRFNSGQRGLQIERRPDDIVAVLQPIVAALTAYPSPVPRVAQAFD